MRRDYINADKVGLNADSGVVRIALLRSLIAVLFCFYLLGCGQSKSMQFVGRTMGTTYSVIIAEDVNDPDLANAIDACLKTINQQMSCYQADSEISHFNRASADQDTEISWEFSQVMEFALDLAYRSKGAFDPTIGPLVNIWGFGSDSKELAAPTALEIEKARGRVGYWYVVIPEEAKLRKEIEGLELDLGAIAKGRAVDCVAELLRKHGYSNFLVEVGGETFCMGTNAEQKRWRVGLQAPEYGALHGSKLRGVLQLSGVAAATSGDYQQFFRDSAGKVYSHIVDPRTAHPTTNQVASVTVIADSCMAADGLATALFVLGPDEGLELLDEYEDVHALFLMRGKDENLEEVQSPGFAMATSY